MAMKYNLKKITEDLVAGANFKLGKDIFSLLAAAYRNETGRRAKKALDWILENSRIAEKEKSAICQDTGLPVVFIEVGKGVKIGAEDIAAIEEGVKNGYAKNYLRASSVDPFKRDNSFYGGLCVHVDFNPGIKGVKITILPKGFGSENKSAMRMFNPTASLEAIEDFIVESVKKAGPQACPPFVVGVGIGSTSDGCLLLAKKALLGDLRLKNQDTNLAKIEKRLLEKINASGIGPMGLGGKTTALAVKIIKAPTHIAGLPVGVNISCHALRRACIKITL